MNASGAAELLRSIGLAAMGPVRWGIAPSSVLPGVYVIEAPEAAEVAPIDAEAVRAWIERVPTLRLDQTRPTTEALADRLAEFWIPSEAVVYIGLAGTSLRSRVGAFYRTPLGDPRPHAGGHWLKTLLGLEAYRVWWAETNEPERNERQLLERFADRAGPSLTGRAAVLALPFANRADAYGNSKPHGIAASTLPRQRRDAAQGPLPGRGGVIRPGASQRSVDRVAGINLALQTMACARPSHQISAVDAAAELDSFGLLNDSPDRPGLPLRKLLRAGRIQHAYQEAGRWWFIRCAAADGSQT
jgi:hypothetical protein